MLTDGDGVTQHGGHTPNTRLTETCSFGLQFTSLILHIHVMKRLNTERLTVRLGYNAFTETGATQKMKTNQMAELKQ